ncbi:MAG: bifunctional uridylyltransferase/uridylyl-removing enzyme [Acidimicrobiia bacterium]|nr:MAG: bifunctional uridylyltransferase/uridylyl-removing enzyme [Acidimicrobiia bacterium]
MRAAVTPAASSLRERRTALVADGGLRGAAFGRALADVLDEALGGLLAELAVGVPVALVALGSYARRELCPGSDVDVLLLHDARGRNVASVRSLAERCWYPLWDAGFVTGHGVRTVKESLALAEDDVDALTAMLEVRLVAGDGALVDALRGRTHDLARRRRDRLLPALADAADARRVRPGPVAEMLEPDLKEGAGGLRDVQALGWAAAALGADGVRGLVGRGYLTAGDARRLTDAHATLLDTRVALHRVTGGRGDRLVLQEQDAVAAAVGAADADALVRDLARAGRDVAWITRDVWGRVRDVLAGPPRRGARRERALAPGVVLRDGRVAIVAPDPVPASVVLEAAAAAADEGAPFERATLTRLGSMQPPTWDVWERASFLRLLRAGRRAVPVFEALDHEGVLERVLPEWAHVRSRPQRNAYHRHTVDRHLLEAVAECAELLDEGEGSPPSFDGVVARACRRPELLLLAALLHDIGKGHERDHSEVGAETALAVARRIGLDSEGREVLTWLVRDHLLMADVATRRDLSDAAVADNLAARCSGDAERLRLLYLLTIGDSRATGPAAWGPAKAALVRDLFVKAAAAIERGEAAALAADRREALAAKLGEATAREFLDRLPAGYVLAFDAEEMAAHAELLGRAPTVRCVRDDGRVSVTVVARDRPRLLATLSGALTICGLDVSEAFLFSTADGLALDVFRATDPYGRLADGVETVESTLRDALEGRVDVAGRVAARRRDYPRAPGEPGPVSVDVDVTESATDTVIEVHADDDVGLLHRLSSTLADLGLDVRVAKVATLGRRVVDVFYVRDARGGKLGDPDAVEEARRRLVAALAG